MVVAVVKEFGFGRRTDEYTRAVAAPPTTRGWFITIEGPEGAGKTSQAARLAEYLERGGSEVILTREPGGTPFGEQIRELLLAHPDGPIDPTADAFLFNAARRQLVDQVLAPALAAGTTVICTRWADSTLAYQGFGAGVPLDDLRSLEVVATAGLRPDLTVLLDLPVELGLARKSPNDLTRFETSYSLDFHRRVRQGFLRLAADEPDRFVVVDASAEPDTVFGGVRAAAEARLIEAPGDPNRRAERISG
jgi:dTMP kinase